MPKKSYDGMSQEDKSADALYCKRHSLAHVLAQAVQELHPGVQLGFGPPVDNGFYYDFLFEKPLQEEDLEPIETKMKEILAQDQVFERRELTVEQAVEMLKGEGEVLKAEYAQELSERGEALSFYKNGPFEDLCAGPHVESTKKIPRDCFKLDTLAGAYWRGSEKNPMLTRIYGLAFNNRKELKKYLREREEAKKFDHRKLSKELDFYTMVDEVGPGLPLWLPNGAAIREELEKFAKETEFKWGYRQVATPHVSDGKLFETSGHLAHYKDGMFPAMEIDEGREYYLKPMNCPFHHMIFKSRPRSYRDLPLRLSEYGHCYRYEQSGAITGLLRVRAMCMNDAHIYCSEDQLEEEYQNVLELHRFYYDKFRINEYWMRFSTHDPANQEKFVDNPKAWEWSEKLIEEVLKNSGIDYEVGFGEAAFYGPKLDFQIRNVVGREETASTNQLDFAVPPRFELEYVGADGKTHTPYCIHRAPLGTHERFLAFLMEHFKGAFPTWMSPVQVMVIPVQVEKFGGYASRVCDELRQQLMRVEMDDSHESFNKKIRKAVTSKIPNILIVGETEENNQEVTWRRYCVKAQQTMPLSEFKALMKRFCEERLMDNFSDLEW